MDSIDVKYIQNKSLEILVEFDSLCRKYGLMYYLAYGTVLGAVRHQGFIPWDDDIDVMMPRPDYEKLKLIVEKEELKNIFISFETNKKWLLPLSKMYSPDTELIEKNTRNKCKIGVYIDIFVLDGVPASSWQRNFKGRVSDIIQTLWYYSDHKPETASKEGFIKKILRTLYQIVPTSFFTSLLIKWAKINKYGCSEYVCNYQYSVYHPRRREIIRRDVLGKGCELMFEGRKFFCPQNYDEYLKKMYGNYMQLPPEDKRCSHHSFDLNVL